MVKNTWTHAYDALPLALRVHGSGNLFFKQAKSEHPGDKSTVNCSYQIDDCHIASKGGCISVQCGECQKNNKTKYFHGSVPSPNAIRPHLCKCENFAQSVFYITLGGLPVIGVCVVAKQGNSSFKQRDAFNASFAVQQTNASFTTTKHFFKASEFIRSATKHAPENCAIVVGNAQVCVSRAAHAISAAAHVMRFVQLQNFFAYRVSQFNVVAHGSCLVCSSDQLGNLVHAKHLVQAAGFCLQCANCQPFNLQLAGIGREIAPLTNRALIATKGGGDFGLRSVVLSDFKCFHVRYYEPSNMRCLIYFYMALLSCD